MKKIALVLGLVAVFALASVASAATLAELQAQMAQIQAAIAALGGSSVSSSVPTITKDLTVGSRGTEVEDLQQYLMDEGLLDIDAPTGYFGPKTKAAVVAWQKANDVSPAAGYFGPKSRAALEALAVTAPTTGTGTTPVVGVTTPGVPGGLTPSLRSTPSNGTDVKKGEELAVASYKLESDDSDMAVSSISLNFNARLWLYADSITILDGSSVVASKTGLSSADFTEVTSGTDYRIRLNSSLVVPKNSEKILTVKVKMLGFTDRTATTITLKNAQFRAVDGTGVTTTADAGDDRTFDFVAANTANVVVNLDASSPLKRIVTTSTTGETDNVVLAVYSIKSENRASTLKDLTVRLNKSQATNGFSTIFSDVRLEVGDKVWSADSVAASSTFSDLDIALPQDTRVALKVVAKVADADNFVDGTMASTTVIADTTSVVAEDSNFDSTTVTAATVNSEDTVLLKNGINVSGISVDNLTAIDNGTSATVGYWTRYKFTLTNNSNSDIFVSAVPSTMLATSSTGNNASSTITSFDPVPAQVSGDVASTAYIIRANGGTRAFSLKGNIKANGTTSEQKLWITKIYFGTASGATTASNIDFGLENLTATATF